MLALDKRNTAERRHVHTHWEATRVRACSEGWGVQRDSIGVRAQQWWRTRSDCRRNPSTACSTYGWVHASMGGVDGLNVSIVDNVIVVVDVELQPLLKESELGTRRCSALLAVGGYRG